MSATLTNYEKIRIHSWYQYILKSATTPVIEQLETDIISINKKITDGVKNLKRKRNSLEGKLRTLHRKGVSVKEMKDFIYEKEELFKKGVYIQDSGGIFSSKDWNKFKLAERSPIKNVVNQINPLFLLSKQKFNEGPCLIFNVFDAITFRQALDCLTSCFDHAIEESTQNGLILPSKNQSSTIEQFKSRTRVIVGSLSQPNRGTSKLAYINECINGDLKQILSKLNIACIHLAIGYIKSKYLDDQGPILISIFEGQVLKIIELECGISDDLWFKPDPTDRNRVLDEFKVSIEFLNQNIGFLKDNLVDNYPYTKRLLKKI
jgi:hypothetical protein